MPILVACHHHPVRLRCLAKDITALRVFCGAVVHLRRALGCPSTRLSVCICSTRARAEMHVTHEEMKAARVPLLFRDYCAHLLIPLNECRIKTWYSPFKCRDLRHGYEKCQYDE